MPSTERPTTRYFNIHIEDYIAYLIIDRLDKRNAINQEMIEDILRICHYFESNHQIRTVIISGSQDVFCAGGDIGQWSNLSAQDFAHSWLRRGHNAFDALARLQKPTIAVLNGHTFGGGLELAACCDYRIAESHIHIGQPESGLGIIPGWSGTQRAVRRFGAQIVRRMAIFGEVFDAQTAHTLGIVDKVVDSGTGIQHAKQLCQQLAKKSQHATRLIKMLINATEGEEQERVYEILAGEIAANSADLQEGIQAFYQKRPAHFSDI